MVDGSMLKPGSTTLIHGCTHYLPHWSFPFPQCWLLLAMLFSSFALNLANAIHLQMFLRTIKVDYSTWKLPNTMSPAAQIQPVERPAVLRTQFWCFSMTWA